MACRGARCVFDCPSGRTLCDASCVDLQTERSHCGACGVTCPPGANATATCTSGACGLTCNAGFANCNGLAGDGCEVNTASDNGNCGACGNRCATGMCSAGSCGGGRTIPGFTGQLGPDYSTSGWQQCVGYLDRLRVDDIPLMGWATPCIGAGYRQLRLACGASASSVRYIDVSRNVFASSLTGYPERGLIIGSNFTFLGNEIYAEGMNPNAGRSWWGGGGGCDERALNLTINNTCDWDAANCFGQLVLGERYLYVYVHP
ncbi:MAG: hypothetical protein HY909_07345 [Deltaproteobacteria bacterium]|nr:hypothetical protein [Deltaproteobacteria bacterium]